MTPCPVMIVDDDDVLRDVVCTILGSVGYQVVPSTCGTECLDALRSGFKGVILMDVCMPGLDGWDTIKAIVDEGLLTGNAICMLTGKKNPDQRGIELESSILDYLAKPFDAQDLVAMVQSAQLQITP